MNKQQLDAIFPRKYWIAEQEIPYLCQKAAEADGAIVEIGAAYGGSAVCFLLGKREGVRVFSVDPFVPDSMSGARATEKDCRAAVRYAVGNALCQDWTLIPQYSYEAVEDWELPIALLFIDGDHTYEAVKRDFEDWSPYVPVDGAILLHDSRRLPADPRVFSRGWPGPTQLVEELAQSGRFEVAAECYSITELRRAT